MKEQKGLTSYNLKWIAIITMFIDHLGIALSFCMSGTVYNWCRHIGRFTYPLFAFMIVEGLWHTRSRKKYLRNIGILAVISELPYDLLRFGWMYKNEGMNVFITLFLGLLVITLVEFLDEKFKGKNYRVFVPILLVCLSIPAYLCAEFFNTDYAGLGVVLIISIYAFEKVYKTITEKKDFQEKGKNIVASIAIVLWMLYYDIFFAHKLVEIWGILTILFILFYNGKRGDYKLSKWFFYFFYPAHLLFIYLFTYFVFR